MNPEKKLSEYYRCPRCHGILKKGPAVLLAQMTRGNVSGNATCTGCGAKYPMSEVCSGKYDVADPTAATSAPEPETASAPGSPREMYKAPWWMVVLLVCLICGGPLGLLVNTRLRPESAVFAGIIGLPICVFLVVGLVLLIRRLKRR